MAAFTRFRDNKSFTIVYKNIWIGEMTPGIKHFFCQDRSKLFIYRCEGYFAILIINRVVLIDHIYMSVAILKNKRVGKKTFYIIDGYPLIVWGIILFIKKVIHI